MNLPGRPAWFRHRVAARAHLGVFDPERSAWLDCGPGQPDALYGPAASQAFASLSTQGEVMAAAPDFLVPVPRPGKILCLGKNFADHAAEFGSSVPDEPMFFAKLPDTLLPAGAAIQLPFWLESRVDHEIELGVILGFDDPDQQGRRYVAPDAALDLVAGYTIVNDVTARHMQGDDRKKQHPWLRCKSFDTFCPIGPCVVPKGELPASFDLGLRCEVNGELRQESRSSLMVVDIAHAIAWISRHCSLRPGDLLLMGTPAGVGPLREGDRVDCWIEELGCLSNPVQREAAPPEFVDPWQAG